MWGESIQFVCKILSARDLQNQDFSLVILGIVSLDHTVHSFLRGEIIIIIITGYIFTMIVFLKQCSQGILLIFFNTFFILTSSLFSIFIIEGITGEIIERKCLQRSINGFHLQNMFTIFSKGKFAKESHFHILRLLQLITNCGKKVNKPNF